MESVLSRRTGAPAGGRGRPHVLLPVDSTESHAMHVEYEFPLTEAVGLACGLGVEWERVSNEAGPYGVAGLSIQGRGCHGEIGLEHRPDFKNDDQQISRFTGSLNVPF